MLLIFCEKPSKVKKQLTGEYLADEIKCECALAGYLVRHEQIVRMHVHFRIST